MKSTHIRQTFIDYFNQLGHTVVDSSSLVPAEDPSLLFTNAGMVQFKDILLGNVAPPYPRAVSAQRCLRAGGKHNDLENVGYTARHHTFFEMLGNFSFADYFKREAIQYAWTFLTRELGLAADKLWVTVHDSDDEAADIWLKDIKVSPERFSRCGDVDNFWSMGETGPCGPCTEIFYDHGPEVAGGPPGSPEQEGDRYIEMWNLVFMQYNRGPTGELTPLASPAVDTGMGLERVAAIMQGVHSNYATDLFLPLIACVKAMAADEQVQPFSLQVIADHIRASAFLISDGIRPSNEGRGYVLRRIIRRAVRHGHQLGIKEPFFYRLVTPLVAEMGEPYPELLQAKAVVEKVLEQEEAQFSQTLDMGLKELEKAVYKLNNKTIPGDVLFKLYDTYGFPIDLTADYAKERGLDIDTTGFDAAMSAQRIRSQSASQFQAQQADALSIQTKSKFTGYDVLKQEGRVEQLLLDGQAVQSVSSGQQVRCVLSTTSFYAESGGQVGDRGFIRGANGGLLAVQTTHKIQQAIVHQGVMQAGELHVGELVLAQVDENSRNAIRRNHSATHLLHASLRHLLGDHVVQKGSLVNAAKLRFDFTHFSALTGEELMRIESLVNEQIRANSEVTTQLMSMDAAIAMGAMALFDEKYGDRVRVLSMGDTFSIELCGGTHVSRTGDIGFFKIISEKAIAAGVRRLEALTGDAAVQWVGEQLQTLASISEALHSSDSEVMGKIQQLQARSKALEESLLQEKRERAKQASADVMQDVQVIEGIKVLVAKMEHVDAETLRGTVDRLKSTLGTAVICLATSANNKVNLVAGVTRDIMDRIPASDVVNVAAGYVGGKGGGRPDMAQAGGALVDNLDQALRETGAWISKKLRS